MVPILYYSYRQAKLSVVKNTSSLNSIAKEKLVSRATFSQQISFSIKNNIVSKAPLDPNQFISLKKRRQSKQKSEPMIVHDSSVPYQSFD